MFLHQLFLFVLLISKMAQLKHSKKVVPNDAFIGILIVYLLIQSLTSNTKEFAVPGASTTLGLDEQAWSNLHAIIHQLYSGGILTIPGNVHIKGDLLVGTYKSTPSSTEQPWATAINSAYNYSDTPPVVNTGRIYSWNARHMETCTGFICRESGPLAAATYKRDDIWFMSYEAFKAGATVKQTLYCGHIECENIKCAAGKSIAVDKISATNDTRTIQIWSNTELSGGKDLFVSRDLKVGRNTSLEKSVKMEGILDPNRQRGKGWCYNDARGVKIDYE
jgi:hypothetical protein